MEKRLILAITLSVLVMLIFQRLIQPPVHVSPNIEATPPKQAELVTQQSKLAVSPKPIKESETSFETDKFFITFTNIGGAVKGVRLKEYKTSLTKELEAPFFMLNVISDEIEPDLSMSGFALLKEPHRLTYEYTALNNLKIRKEFILHNNSDYIELRLNIQNNSNIPKNIGYSMIGPSGIEPLTTTDGRNFVELDAKVDGKIQKRVKIRGAKEYIDGTVSWLALKNRYFVIALSNPNPSEGIELRQIKNEIITTLKISPRAINPNSSVGDSYLLYLGPLSKNRLAALNAGFEDVINYGFFGGISVFLLSILRAINSIAHNWGIAIIGVTCLINLILFPLTKKSLSSMQKMQELQPHIEKLRNLHKDNPQKLNKEMIELYRQYNVNPFGGCLPMLLQLPIFIAFYQALMRSIELKDAAFLWIKDLSSPDALFVFQKPLPFIGDRFNLLPIITITVMVIQQRLSTAHTVATAQSSEMAKQQKFMAIFFPFFFGIILYNFPSGLVLYWMTNSILMITEQILLKRRRAA